MKRNALYRDSLVHQGLAKRKRPQSDLRFYRQLIRGGTMSDDEKSESKIDLESDSYPSEGTLSATESQAGSSSSSPLPSRTESADSREGARTINESDTTIREPLSPQSSMGRTLVGHHSPSGSRAPPSPSSSRSSVYDDN